MTSETNRPPPLTSNTLQTNTEFNPLPPSVFVSSANISMPHSIIDITENDTGIAANPKEIGNTIQTQYFLPSTLKELFSERIVSTIVPPPSPLQKSKQPHDTDIDKGHTNANLNNKNITSNDKNNKNKSSEYLSSTTVVTIPTPPAPYLHQEPSQHQQTQRKQRKKDLILQPMSEEQRIQERNRKGRERSLRTRRRNSLRLKILEQNVVYLTTENTLLKDFAQRLSVMPNSTTASSLHRQIFMSFTALLLCASSRPQPYMLPTNSNAVTNNNNDNTINDKGDVKLADLEVTGTAAIYSTAAIITTPISALEATLQCNRVSETKNKKNEDTPVEVKEEDIEAEAVEVEVDMENERRRLQHEQQQLQLQLQQQQDVRMMESGSPDFGLSVDELRMAPALNVDELDRLLQGEPEGDTEGGNSS